MRQLETMLVGGHFRPPAKTVLARLPSGVELALIPENDNPYDEEAIKVMFDPKNIPESQFQGLEEELPLQGYTLEQVMSGGELHLGYIPKTGGKPLLKAQQEHPHLVGNHEVREALLDPGHKAKLVFGGGGELKVIVEYE